ncbi:MAG: sulfatase [Bacteroidota bacterium]|nr:sulfatase [Bacteroidota bacterium]
MKIALTAIVAFVSVYFGCRKDPVSEKKSLAFRTNKLVIIVVDGPRYTETWGLTGRPLIPHRSEMLREGVLCTQFYNNGYCFTNAGHSAITTGVYQNINNSGLEYPQNPSIFQYWLKFTGSSSSKAWVIATKDKLEILSDCLDPEWQGKYRPMTNCGTAGLGSGYRQDTTTLRIVESTLSLQKPQMMLINFKQPDAAAHAADSLAYIQGIEDTDNYVWQIWQQIQADPFYRDQTTMIVTNDHGRHTAGHLDGYVSHTDTCDGCKHIEFFAMGPDFKKNHICSQPHEQIDITQTVAHLMGFRMPTANGRIMTEIFK